MLPRRQVAGRPDGQRYLTVHQRRQALVLGAGAVDASTDSDLPHIIRPV